MKPIFYIFFTLFIILSNLACAQKTDKVQNENTYHSEMIRDSIFENVIQIIDNNVATNGIDYIFDVSISKNTQVPVLFIQTKVPLNLLPTIYPEFSKIIVITPNWTYYAEVSGNQPKGVDCAEPMASSIVYEFNRENGKLQKDSLVIKGGNGFPEMKFSEYNQLKNNEIKIYYTESYGSDCCPRDQQLDNKPTREEFISFFEKENKVKITDTYAEMRGKEGEVNFYYTLNQLSNHLKLKFILERDFYRIINRHTKDIIKTPQIYTPKTITLHNKIEKL
ncbi:hypothetical protein J2X31_003647 [Flavobacterium arsenatis]|uniref:Uncharacterized protein n=1 Tax=Flavobacterium arsenatis TaxID=1484332 RepID=A0ABU1TUQ7_9FLAO|nr:hypothetical protein [Flavobacterium arsenatis]MDR6969614.1 hypothetical protein [Flavobacterium arsenatis]